jgi:hypothetical protein
LFFIGWNFIKKLVQSKPITALDLFALHMIITSLITPLVVLLNIEKTID